jgi:hypothetical protein
MKVYVIRAAEQGNLSDSLGACCNYVDELLLLAKWCKKEPNMSCVDEYAATPVDFNTNANLIVLFADTPNVLRAYDIARYFKEKGKTVVLAGQHVRDVPKEGLFHADSIVMSKLNWVWDELLSDFSEGSLKRIYQRQEAPNKLPNPSFAILKTANNSKEILIGKYSELLPKLIPQEENLLELCVDASASTKKNLEDLFLNLKASEISWTANFDLLILLQFDLVRQAVECGMMAIQLDLNSFLDWYKIDLGRKETSRKEALRVLDLLNKHEVEIKVSVHLGHDHHSPEIFQELIDFCTDQNLHAVKVKVFVPLPGSATFKKLQYDGRIITEDWALYNGTKAVFDPKHFHPDDLERAVQLLNRLLNTLNDMDTSLINELRTLKKHKQRYE